MYEIQQYSSIHLEIKPDLRGLFWFKGLFGKTVAYKQLRLKLMMWFSGNSLKSQFQEQNISWQNHETVDPCPGSQIWTSSMHLVKVWGKEIMQFTWMS